MNKHSPDKEARPPLPGPRPSVLLFAAGFVIAMFINLYFDATRTDYAGERVTIFLGAAALLTLGVDIGKLIGRR